MREFAEVPHTLVRAIAIVCDRCGKRITKKDWLEWQEVFHFSGCGGYGSKFGDSRPFTLDLCGDCWHDLVGNLVRYQDEQQSDPDPTSDAMADYVPRTKLGERLLELRRKAVEVEGLLDDDALEEEMRQRR